MPTKPSIPLQGRDAQVRAITHALLVGDIRGDGVDLRQGPEELLRIAGEAVLAVRNISGLASASSAQVASCDARFAEALDLLDRAHKAVRPALEQGRRLTAQLAADLAEEERLAAEAAAAAAREARIEAEIDRRTTAAEADRLAAIAVGVRADLIGTA